MTVFFDGKAYARKMETKLYNDVNLLRNKGVRLQLYSLQIGDNSGSEVYLKLKKNFAERIGVVMHIVKIPDSEKFSVILDQIKSLNISPVVSGIMIQLPIAERFSSKERVDLINSIAPEKDVDGMRDKSEFTAPVVRAIECVIEESRKINIPRTIAVVGASGFVGRKITNQLSKTSYKVLKFDIGDDLRKSIKISDLVISATGKANIIKSEFIKTGCVLIDIGAPQGEIEPKAFKKASYASRAPGGVGPVTIAFLLDNLLKSVKS